MSIASEIRMHRAWAMPHRSTFSIAPIAKIIAETVPLFGVGWVDPFAGWASPAETTNDLNPSTPADYHLTALDFLRMFEDESVDGVLFDPPYSPRQVSECYQEIGREVTADDTKATFWSDCKNEIARIVRPAGTVMCFGWNSNGIGKGRGFAIERVLTVAHGGHHNDTIVTVERKRAAEAEAVA